MCVCLVLRIRAKAFNFLMLFSHGSSLKGLEFTLIPCKWEAKGLEFTLNF